MCWTKRKKNFKKKKRIYPKPPPLLFNSEEIIYFNGCHKNLPLSEIKINCNGCNLFYHCKIAGKCYGPNCTEMINYEKHHLSWCLNCIPMKIPNQKYLCNECN